MDRQNEEKISGAFNWSIIFLLIGLAIIALALVMGIVRANVAAEYWSNPKAVRDAAGPGSALLGNLRFLQSTNAWLEPLKFNGLAFIIVGIAVSFGIVILRELRRRLDATGQLVTEFLRKG